ncbi:alpha/beta hydrolase [Micromonospora profundi]|uniref:alpha/beta hydrolase n=1 Tax=Micromonospora profundi TaxID=1420889 RepID=UPI0033B407F6
MISFRMSKLLPTARRRAVVAAATAGVVAVALVAGSASGAGQRPTAKKPTIVLVHGAFADASSWNGVVKHLKRDGYPVIAPANPLRDLQSDAEYVRSVVDSVSGPVVVVGHSYGGSVLSEAVAGDRDVKALVFVASFMLKPGESTSDLSGMFPGNELAVSLDEVPFPTSGGGSGTDLYVQQRKFGAVFAGDVPRDIADVMAATQRPVTAAALNGKATKAAWTSIPSWNMIAIDDLAIPVKAQRYMAKRAGAHTVEIKASHAVTVSRPQAVANLIDKAARSTSR